MGLRVYRDRKLAEKREDFATITENVATVLKATAAGKPTDLKNLKSVRTPIGGFRLGDDKVTRISKKTGWPFDSPEHKRLMDARERNAKHDKALAAWTAESKKKSTKRKKKKRSVAQKRATAKMRRALAASKRKSNVKFEPRFHKRGPNGGWRGIG